MPSRINGIGTWYWGKNNIITRNAKCEFCGNPGQLISFDTTLYFTFLFLPIIPLQRKRVLSQCPRCRRHRVIPLKKWEEQKTTALVDALNAWQADRGNADKARQAVNVTVGYQDRHAFEDLSTPIAQAFPRDADMQLFLAAAHDHFDQPAAAEKDYRSAVAIRNDPSTRRAYAEFLMRQLRPDEAKPLLADILAAKDRAGAPLLLLEAQAYQAVGNHAAAASLLDETTTAFPDLLSTPEFQRISAISAKYRGTTKRITAANLDPAKRGGAKQAGWFHRNGAKAVIGTILAAAAAWYLIDAATSSNHKTFIVNGTSLSYKVLLNGQEHSVPARSELPLDLEEGHYMLSVANHPEIEPASFDMRTNFWGRPFNRRVFVINPDRTALLFADDVVYTSSSSSTPSSGGTPPQFYVGQVVYNLKKPDDAFTQPPKTVESEGSNVTRRHLGQLDKLPLDSQIEVIHKYAGAAAVIDWMQRVAASSDDGPQTMELLSALEAHLPPADMIAFLRPRLTDRPVRVLWHRLYQSLMEKTHPDYDLAAEYRALLAKSPDDSSLIYLAGRSSTDRNEAKAMFTKAAHAPTPCAYALYALAYEDIGQARFDAALPLVQQASQLAPNDLQIHWVQTQVWEALGQTNSALQLARSQETHDGADHDVISEEVRLLVAGGNNTAAKQRIDGYCAELSSLHFDQEDIDFVRKTLNSAYSYAVNDIPALKEATKDMKTQDITWQLALIDKNYDAAEQNLKEQKTTDAEQYLTLSALASAGGNQAVSDRAWTKAKELLTNGIREERALAAKLARNAPLSPDTILQEISGFPLERCAMLICLGQRNPEQRDAFFALAKKLNFSTRFPHRELAAAMAAK